MEVLRATKMSQVTPAGYMVLSLAFQAIGMPQYSAYPSQWLELSVFWATPHLAINPG
jgi:hypothetical protein